MHRPPSAAAALALALALAGPVAAKPVHKQALGEYFGPYLSAKLFDCRTCHLPDSPGDSLRGGKPHNRFGERLVELRKELRKAGRDTSIAARLEAAAEEDSDGDGVSNLIELLTGHNPGDPADRPTDAEVEEAQREKLPAFRKYLAGYRWRPFTAVSRPPVPAVRDVGWVRNPVDAFVAAEREGHRLLPRPEADRATLLRRVSLDLTGLPPTPEELHRFITDPASDAYEQVVDRLLASPQYGERWGRHWMDVWRYSDWAGYGPQVRDSQPHVWHWRDWIVESLNRDTPYDQMVRLMLAADELAPEDPDALRATGYLVRNYKLLSREKWLQDTVEHTFQAFQGVTLGCARCHDHMYDPVMQRDYYQVRAIFEPHNVRTDRLPGQPDVAKDGLPRAYDAKPDEPTYLFERGDDRAPDKSAALPPGVPKSIGPEFPEVRPVPLPPAAVAPDRRPFVVRDAVEASARAVTQSRTALATARPKALPAAVALVGAGPWIGTSMFGPLRLAELGAAAAEAKHAALLAVLAAEELEAAGVTVGPAWEPLARATAAAQRLERAATARLDLAAAAAAKRPAAAQALAKAEAELAALPTTAYAHRPVLTYPALSTGRRSALARWLTDRANPLAARVAVNHVWARHFGRGLVPTVADFGRNGRPPSHPALLDYLAAEFMDRGWSMKAIHRLIVTSATYRLASTPDPDGLARDRDDVYLWRMPSRRLEAEAVRDRVLFVAGRLDLTRGGPDIDYALGLTVPRRSLYFRHAAEKQMEFLKVFDAASVTECYRRQESVVPQQAMALGNSELTVRMARLLARDLAGSARSSPEVFAAAAWERVLARPATADELAESVAFLTAVPAGPGPRAAGSPDGRDDPDGQRPSADLGQRARENLVLVLMNHHEFVTVR